MCLVTLITVGVHKASSNRKTWLTEPTSYVRTLPKRALCWWTHENFANCSTLKFWHVIKISIQNLTRCNFLHWKYDALCFFSNSKSDASFFHFKIWHVMKFLKKHFAFLKSTMSKICDFDGKKTNQNVIFWMKTFLQYLTNFLNKFDIKILGVLLSSIQNLMRCNAFKSNSDALEGFNWKSDKFEKFFPKSDFCLVFPVPTEWWYLLSTLIPTYFEEEN